MMKLLSAKDVLNMFDMTYLKNASTFGALSEEAIRWLINEGKLQELSLSEDVFCHDERGDSFYIILQGRLSYYKWYNDKYAFIRHYEFGQQIGFMSMIALHPRVGKAVADEKCIFLEINTSLFYQLHENMTLDFGVLMMNLAREMARTLCDVDNKIVEISMSNEVGKSKNFEYR
jgi:CRP-like cAMP-binding protein